MSRPRALALSLLAGVLLLAPAAAQALPAEVTAAAFPRAAGLSAVGGTVALTTPNGANHAHLLVGAPELMIVRGGAGSLPSWAQPHVGTDALGFVVVTYPRCSDDGPLHCRLWNWHVSKQTAALIGGVHAQGGSELEGAMEHGALAFARRSGKQGQAAASLNYKSRTAKRSRLVTKLGGTNLALHGAWIAQIRDLDPKFGECGRPSVELVTTNGKRRAVRSEGCGQNGQTFVAPAFLGGTLFWAFHTVMANSIWQYDPHTRRILTAQVRSVPTGFAPATGNRALLLDSATPAAGDGPATPPPSSLVRVSGLQFAAPVAP